MSNRQQGFTLVEIAIVLVIIGLLLGGILKGQEMITQAKIKNVIADFSGISAAYHGYQDRYRAIPGDDPNAATRWASMTNPPPVAGNGNGIVAGTYNNGGAVCTTAVESCSWWDHLRKAGFVSGNGPTQPFNALTGQIGVSARPTCPTRSPSRWTPRWTTGPQAKARCAGCCRRQPTRTLAPGKSQRRPTSRPAPTSTCSAARCNAARGVRATHVA